MWREQRRCPIQQKTSQPMAHLGRAMVTSSSGLLVLACPGQSGSGQWLSLQISSHRAVEGMEAAIAVIADVHHPPTGRAVAVEDVEFPESEIGIRGPVVRHRTDPPCTGRFAGSRDTP